MTKYSLRTTCKSLKEVFMAIVKIIIEAPDLPDLLDNQEEALSQIETLVSIEKTPEKVTAEVEIGG